MTSMLRTVWRPWNFIIEVEMMFFQRFLCPPQPFTTVCSKIIYRPMSAGR